MGFLISTALAATTSTVPSTATMPQSDGSFTMVMIAAIFVLFYFMLIRPQNKRAKEHKALISQLKKGDEVITAGGVVGKIAAVDEQFIKISLSEGVDMHVQRSAVTAVLPKGTIKSL